MRSRLSSFLVALRPWLAVVFVVGFAYVGYRVVADYAMLRDALMSWSWPALAAGFMIGMLCSLVRAAYRLGLYRLSGFGEDRLPAVLALRSYAWGQLMRYIPGKIAGPATEASLLHHFVGVAELAKITLFELVAMLLLSLLWLGASLLWIFEAKSTAGAAWVAAIAFVFWLHLRQPHLSGAGTPRGANASVGIQAAWCTTWLVLEWLLFYVLWVVIADEHWFTAATSYAAASWVGAVVFVAPAGLGVREAVYAVATPMVSQTSQAEILAQALAARLLLTAADLSMPLAFLAIRRKQHAA